MGDPTLGDVRSIAGQYGFNMSDGDLAGHQAWLTGLVAGFTAVDELPDNLPKVKYPGRSSSPRNHAASAVKRSSSICVSTAI